MEWYDHLYVGKKAKRKRHTIIRGIRDGVFDPLSYVITPPQNGNNILDIYPAAMLLLPPYKDQDMLILGIAADYWEALEVVRRIVDEMYQRTGGFDLAALLKERQ